MKKKLSRRNALRTGLGITSGLFLGSTVGATNSTSLFEGFLAKTKVQNASIVKHGRTKGDKMMVWSLMETGNLDEVLAKVESFRNATKYQSELKYSSNDLFKIPYAKSVIDYILEASNFTFTMVVFKDYEEILASLSPNKYQQRMINMYRELPVSDMTAVGFKKENLFGPSEQFTIAMQEVNGYAMEMTNPKTDSLIQINDFISGMVFAMLRENEVKAKTKLELIEYFKEKLGISGKVSINSFAGTKIKIHLGKV